MEGHSMVGMIKNYIKTKPRLFDLLNSFRPIESPVERWLDEFSKANNKKVNFIQIGASDGLRWDPVRRFVIRDRWNGILVEPLPPVFEMLKSNYSYLHQRQNLIFVNAAISSKDERMFLFWSYSDEFLNQLSFEDKMYYLRKSSSEKDFVEATLKQFSTIEDKIKCFSVQCISVNSLVEKYWGNDKIDLILIDAEGHDDTIIRGIDFDKIHPKAVLFESHNLGGRQPEIYDFLSRKNYKVLDLGGDSVAERIAKPRHSTDQ